MFSSENPIQHDHNLDTSNEKKEVIGMGGELILRANGKHYFPYGSDVTITEENGFYVATWPGCTRKLKIKKPT